MDKVAEFYARWFARKPVQEYSAAEAASEELAKELIGVHESNKRDFWQSCRVKFLRGTILHLSWTLSFIIRMPQNMSWSPSKDPAI
jgi:hypothetical protein